MPRYDLDVTFFNLMSYDQMRLGSKCVNCASVRKSSGGFTAQRKINIFRWWNRSGVLVTSIGFIGVCGCPAFRVEFFFIRLNWRVVYGYYQWQ